MRMGACVCMCACVHACVRETRNRASKINNSITKTAIFSINLYMYLVHGKIVTIFTIFWSTFYNHCCYIKSRKMLDIQSIMYFMKMCILLIH